MLNRKELRGRRGEDSGQTILVVHANYFQVDTTDLSITAQPSLSSVHRDGLMIKENGHKMSVIFQARGTSQLLLRF
ncbi:hypothetical protein Bpfe_024841 [Biomphalaria pfeifferi]|uniref:Uncharacterized protein n=1 Tax=Biomphalaria pfeifferi TaxID=112525 RepID=A0AAD8B0H1_BIOPF|nr:hypothetical protein Bpfe_024841 [Biomphalaria pfeifferi]